MKRVALISEFAAGKDIHSLVRNVAASYNAEAVSVDRFEREGHVVERLVSLFKRSDLVVAHLVEPNPNSLYEIGLAHGLDLPVVIIMPSNAARLPADLQSMRAIYYNDDGTFESLKFKLENIFEKVLVREKLVRGLTVPRRSKKRHDIKDEKVKSDFDQFLRLEYHQRASAFERWFSNLAAQIEGWEVVSSGHRSKDRGYDFVIWSSLDDSEMTALGNPIPVELKATKQLRRKFLEAMYQRAQIQNFKCLVLVTTAEVRSTYTELAHKLLESHSFFLLLLGRNELREVESPKDLVEEIRARLLSLMYGADYEL